MIKQSSKKGLFTLFIIIMVISSSCKGGGPRTVDSSTYHPDLPKPFDMGSVKFEVDPTRTASLDYIVDTNEEQVLQVTDASGITWTLTLPVGTLDYDQTVTMTAMSQLTSTDIPGDLIGGVVLEPDGLTFVNPPTITLSGTGEEAVILLFTGKQDGTGNEFALTKLGDPQTSATLYHFSTFWGNQVGKAKASGDTAWAKYAGKMGKELDELIAMAKALLNYDLEVPVPPPAVEFGCKDDQGKKNDDQKIQEYIDQFIEPEAYFIRELGSKAQFQGAVSGHWEYNQFTGKMVWVGETDERILTLMTQLAERIAAKFDILIKMYGTQSEYFPVMVRLLLQIQKSVEMVGGDQTPFTKYYSALNNMVDKVYETLFDKLINGHDYSAFNEIMSLSRLQALLGLPSGDIFTKLEKAMIFKMKGNYTWNDPEGNWELKTEFTISFSFAEMAMKGSGNGTISYTSALDLGVTRKSGGFSEDVIVMKFDFCSQKANVIVTPYAAEMDTFITPPQYHIPPISRPLSMAAWTVPFKDKNAKDKTGNSLGNLYGFPVNWFNKDSSPVNDSFEGKKIPNSSYFGIFKIMIEHTPQKIK
jgi:hypothetical protein